MKNDGPRLLPPSGGFYFVDSENIISDISAKMSLIFAEMSLIIFKAGHERTYSAFYFSRDYALKTLRKGLYINVSDDGRYIRCRMMIWPWWFSVCWAL